MIYVNLADDRFRFAALSDSADMWLDMQNYCDRAYLPQYRDDRNTILILDEIQTSKKVYNAQLEHLPVSGISPMLQF